MASKKGKAYITIEKGADGKEVVTDHKSKKEAHAHGAARRKAGATIFAHSAADAEKHGLDPRKKGGRVINMATAKKKTAPKHGGDGGGPRFNTFKGMDAKQRKGAMKKMLAGTHEADPKGGIRAVGAKKKAPKRKLGGVQIGNGPIKYHDNSPTAQGLRTKAAKNNKADPKRARGDGGGTRESAAIKKLRAIQKKNKAGSTPVTMKPGFGGKKLNAKITGQVSNPGAGPGGAEAGARVVRSALTGNREGFNKARKQVLKGAAEHTSFKGAGMKGAVRRVPHSNGSNAQALAEAKGRKLNVKSVTRAANPSAASFSHRGSALARDAERAKSASADARFDRKEQRETARQMRGPAFRTKSGGYKTGATRTKEYRRLAANNDGAASSAMHNESLAHMKRKDMSTMRVAVHKATGRNVRVGSSAGHLPGGKQGRVFSYGGTNPLVGVNSHSNRLSPGSHGVQVGKKGGRYMVVNGKKRYVHK